jgi:peroxiredoxin
MKKLVFIAIALLTFACNGKHQDGFVIKGTIKDLKQHEAYLVTYKDGVEVKLDSAVVDTVKGTFRLQGKVETPDLLYLTFPDGAQIEVFVENAAITIQGDSIQNAIITGSRSHDEYAAYKESRDTLEKSFEPQYAAYDSVLSKYNEIKNSGNDAETRALYDRLSEIEALPGAKMEQYNVEFVKNHGASYVAPVVLWNELAWSLDAPEMELLVKCFDSTIHNSRYVVLLNERIETLKKVAIGNPAPDFTLNDTLGNPQKLSAFYGKVLLIDFWASWCGPCRRENPNIVAAYKEFSPKGFDIVGVSLDKTKVKWIKAIEDDKLTWHHISDLQGWNSAAGKLYGIRSIPSNLLLDKNGIIIAKNLMGDDLTDKLRELLK